LGSDSGGIGSQNILTEMDFIVLRGDQNYIGNVVEAKNIELYLRVIVAYKQSIRLNQYNGGKIGSRCLEYETESNSIGKSFGKPILRGISL
jgi:hypothetical protein